jgi:RecA/RadA recombinase
VRGRESLPLCGGRIGGIMEINRKKKNLAEEMRDAVSPAPATDTRYLSTGSTLWNLALSDNIDGGWSLGTIHRFIGGPASGKTFAVWSAFAEALHTPFFDDYDLHYRDIERAFKIASFLFSKDPDKVNRILTRLVDAKEKNILATPDGVPETIQDWRLDMDHIYKKNKPFICALDTLDALDSLEERARIGKANLAIENERKSKEGGFRTEKAVHAGVILRTAASKVAENDSILIVVSQTRDNVGVMFGSKETTSGGNAPEFYATTSTWLHVKRAIKKKDTQVGVEVRVQVKKNKQTGKVREVEFPILVDYGINDIQSMVSWMVREEFWGGSKELSESSKIDTGGDFKPDNMAMEKLVFHIASDRQRVRALKQIVGESWAMIEKEIATKLPPKYE